MPWHGNQSAEVSCPGPYDPSVVFTVQPVYAGQKFVIRIDTRNEDKWSLYSFVSLSMFVIVRGADLRVDFAEALLSVGKSP